MTGYIIIKLSTEVKKKKTMKEDLEVKNLDVEEMALKGQTLNQNVSCYWFIVSTPCSWIVFPISHYFLSHIKEFKVIEFLLINWGQVRYCSIEIVNWK